MPIYRLGDDAPVIHPSCYVADSAILIGKVFLAENASVWDGAVLRGDNEPIRIGVGSNIQEAAILHTDPGCPLDLEDGVTIGHQAMLHGCRIRAGSLVGIQSVILNKAVIGAQCLVGAGAIVTEGKVFPPRSLIIGAPASVKRTFGEEDLPRLKANADSYVARAQMFRKMLVRVG